MGYGIPEEEGAGVVSAGFYKHPPSWPRICAPAIKAQRPLGEFIVTCAGPGREKHP